MYFGDTARLPYGNKSKETVTRFSVEIASFLVRQNVKCIVVACNTASSHALEALRHYQWSGNVRELENTIHRAVLLAQGIEIGPEAILTPEGDSIVRDANDATARRAAEAAEAATRALVGRTVADVERELILDTLDHCLGNRTHAAKILGISIRTLRNKLNEYVAFGVDVPEPGAARIATA